MKKIVASLTLSVLGLLSPLASAYQDITVYYPNGAVVSVPTEGWEVQIAPKGFNSLPYSETTNTKGKLPGWGGWPEYKKACEGLSLGGVCDREPYFISVDPVEATAPAPAEKQCTKGGELSLGGESC